MPTRGTLLPLLSAALALGLYVCAGDSDAGTYATGRVPHLPKPSKADYVDVGCEELVPFNLQEVSTATIWLSPQFRVTVPEGSKSLMVYVYDPEDYNRNNFDVVIRFGQEVGFEETSPGSGQGRPIYDIGGFTQAAYEECPIYNNDGSAIQAGDYYFAIISRPDRPGGPVAVKACVDGGFHALAEGASRVKTFEAFLNTDANDMGEQCVLEVPPAGVSTLLLTLEPAAFGDDFTLALRVGAPLGATADGLFDPALPDTYTYDAFGGFQEVCVGVPEGGFTLYIGVFGETATAREAAITARFDACTAPLGFGEAGCKDKIVRGVRYDPGAATNEAADVVQYRVTVTPEQVAACTRGELAVSIAQANVPPGEETVDFLLYCNVGAPIPRRDDNGLPDFEQAPAIVFHNGTAGPGPETLVFADAALVAGDYWFLVSRDSGSSDAPPAYARLCATLVCGASFKRGFVNEDATLNIADAVSLLGYLFAFKPAPSCLDACDANDDGKVNIADAISLLGYLFATRPAPSSPFEACGEDPTPDEVSCAAASAQCAGK